MRLLCDYTYRPPKIVQMSTSSGGNREAGIRAEISNMVDKDKNCRLIHWATAHSLALETGDLVIGHIGPEASVAPREIHFRVQRVGTKRITAISAVDADLKNLPMPLLSRPVDWHWHSMRIERHK